MANCYENSRPTPNTVIPAKSLPRTPIRGGNPSPGHGSRRGGFETRPPRCGVKKPATHHRRSRANGNPSPAPTRRWYENRGKTPTSVIPAHAGFLLRRNRPPSSPRTLLAAAIFHLPWCRWQPAWPIVMKMAPSHPTSSYRRKACPVLRYGAGIQSQRRGSQSTFQHWAGPIFVPMTTREGGNSSLSTSPLPLCALCALCGKFPLPGC